MAGPGSEKCEMQTHVLTAERTPFSLDDDHSYALWRARKLAVTGMPDAIVIQDPGELDAKERQALLRSAEKRNFTLFHVRRPPEDIETSLRAFGRRLGLLDLDQNHLYKSPKQGFFHQVSV